MIRPLILLFVVGMLAGGVEMGAGAPAANVDRPRMTLIGDSVAKGLEWNEQALAMLGQGIDLQLQVDVCRRLVGESCPYEGKQVPTLVQLAAALGPRLGQTVIVVAGYNDFAETFAQAVEASVATLVAAGARRIFWATLRAARHPYLAMNEDLRAAAGRHPQLTLVDWNRFSRSHRDWFQNDGIHLYPAGGLALASLLRASLADPASIEADTPPVITTRRLPVGRPGKLYVVELGAKGDAEPYSWSLASGRLPKGLGLEPGGRISGRPQQPGRTSIIVRVTDANGLTATLRLGLLILPPR